jgi:hypothetical protein
MSLRKLLSSLFLTLLCLLSLLAGLLELSEFILGVRIRDFLQFSMVIALPSVWHGLVQSLAVPNFLNN